MEELKINLHDHHLSTWLFCIFVFPLAC
uniref:Uncharacterized protein n=1 Tax=Rhizophora mucronata TaxID=61149 RepID=A0A2P2NTV1_RHIMU